LGVAAQTATAPRPAPAHAAPRRQTSPGETKGGGQAEAAASRAPAVTAPGVTAPTDSDGAGPAGLAARLATGRLAEPIQNRLSEAVALARPIRSA
jgi:hypothetical protein